MQAQAAQIERVLVELTRDLGGVAVASAPIDLAGEGQDCLADPPFAPGQVATGAPGRAAGAPWAYADATGSDWLVGEEQRIYVRHRCARRRAEFLAGRRAAHRAVALALGVPGRAGPEIGEDALGAPAVRGHPALRVSISHSHAVAVAIAAPFAVGVDLELDEPRPEALIRIFFTPTERDRLSLAPPAERQALLNVIWTRKEAAAKVGRWGGRLPFGSLDCSGETIAVWGRRIALRSARTAGYAISVAREIGEG